MSLDEFDFTEEEETPLKEKNYLISIAIDNYNYVQDLNNSVKGSQDLIKVLVEKYEFDEKNVVTLYNEKATRRNILQEFFKLREKLVYEDNLIIIFSGHGDVDQDMGYWIPVDAKPRYAGDWISAYDIKFHLSMIRSFHSVLIVDTMFSGTFLAQLPNNQMKESGSKWLITAQRKGKITADGVPGEKSPFMSGLIEILKNRMDDIGIRNLSLRLSDYVGKQTNGRQVPDFGSLNGIGSSINHFTFHLRPEFKTHDIFLSYARADMKKIKPLVEEFKKFNWTVWWDEEVPPGEKFDETIKKNIDLSKVVIVAWSKASIKSNWVKEEANIGLENKKLLPIIIEDVNPPFGFRFVQASNLSDWEAEKPNENLNKLIKRIKQKINPN